MTVSDLIRREDAIKTVIRMCSPICDWELEKKAYTDCVIDEINSLPSAEPKTDGVFIQGGLTISGEPPMPEGCMDCKLQDRCLCIPPDLSADEISELYISRRPNCPLLMVAEPKTGEWVWSDEDASWKCVCCDCVFEEIDWKPDYNYCPNCGARMEVRKNDKR